MFGHAYFGARYFGPRFFGPAAATTPASGLRGGWMPPYFWELPQPRPRRPDPPVLPLVRLRPFPKVHVWDEEEVLALLAGLLLN